MPKHLFIVFFSFLLIVTQQLNAQIPEELIVFTQNSDSDFTKKTIDSLQKYTNARNIPMKVVVIAQGVPKYLSYTPCMVYQNHLGRSMYKGRLTSFGRILNFVRMVRNAPLGLEEKTLDESHLVYQEGLSKVLFEYKITEPNGEGIKKIKDMDAFIKTAKTGIEEGFKQIKNLANIQVPTASWKFYMSFYPYVDAKGKLYISSEMYSGYDCVNPIYKKFDFPISGKLKKLKKAFAAAAADLEQAWMQIHKNSELGDEINPIPSELVAKSWEESDLRLPAPPAEHIKQLPPMTNKQLPEKWEFAGASDPFIPAVSFSFPEPLTQYSGEAKEISGTMTFSAPQSLDGATGHFEAKTASITMGLEELDEHLHKMFKVKDFPVASFDFKDLKVNNDMDWGELMPFTLSAKFNLKSVQIEVPVSGQVELSVDEDGVSPVLLFYASFQLPELHDTFDLEKPGGDEKANNSVIFSLNFKLKGT